MLTRRALLLALVPLLLARSPLAAQAVPPNSAPKPLFTPNDALLLGGFAVGTVLAAPLDKRLALRLQNPDVQTNRWLRRTARVVRSVAVPGAFLIGGTMYAVGRLADRPQLADLGLHGTEALLIGSATGVVLKGTFGRARPHVHPDPDPLDFKLGRGFRLHGDHWQSFPSGHTIAAFAAAAAVTSETRRYWAGYSWLIGPALYGGAALAGISRVYNNRHWASDVMAGAAIGTFAGLKVVRWHHSHPDNRVDRVLLNVSLAPTPSGAWRQLGFTVVPLP